MSTAPLQPRSRSQAVSILLLALLFIAAGIGHFLRPHVYASIVPPYLPWPLLLAYVSGFFEILGGLGLLVPSLRRSAGWGLIALLAAVFPANIHMALNPSDYAELPFWALLARLPLQFLLAWWVWRATQR